MQGPPPTSPLTLESLLSPKKSKKEGLYCCHWEPASQAGTPLYNPGHRLGGATPGL